MATVFAITTANETLKLEPNQRGEAVFTVTNSTSRPLRGLAKLKPLGNTKQEWLKLAGEGERDFPSGGTQQFTVEINPPPDTPPGQYGFRLDIVSSVNPDEDFTEGPTVTAEVLPPKPPPPSKAWMIPVALIVVLLIVGVIVLIMSRSKKVAVPPVEGQTIEQARELLKKAPLKFTEKQVPAEDPSQVGKVKSVAPKPGEQVESGSTVALEFYGPGIVAVKKVLGSTLDIAKEILEGEQHLQVKVAPEPKATFDFSPGQVAEQDPTPGKQAEFGSPVTLTLAGPTTKVPNIIGDPMLPAMERIVAARLNLSTPVGEGLDGNVLDVKPGVGIPVLEGTRVTLFMPQTPCPTPNCAYLRAQVIVAAQSDFLHPTPSP